MITIPLTNDPSQRLNVILDEQIYVLEIDWNTRGEFWTIGFATSDQIPLVDGIKIVCNLDLIELHKNPLMPRGSLIYLSPGDPGRETLLSESSALVYIPEDEADAI
jgi:hypothetical protein